MSGYKKVTVTIGEQEYHRLLEAENRLRFQQSAQSKKNDHQVQQSLQQMYAHLRDMETRQSEFMLAVGSLDQSVQQVEANCANQILEQAGAFINDLEAYRGDFVASTQELIAQQAEYYQQAIFQEHADRQQDVLRLQRRLERGSRSREQKLSNAQQWIDAGREMQAFILSRYRRGLIPFASLEQAGQALELAAHNLDNGVVDGAILGAQQAYQHLSRLRVDLERAEQEWAALQQAVTCALQALGQQIEAAREFPAIDLDGNELPELIPVDLWTSGRLSALQSEVQQALVFFNSDNGSAASDMEYCLDQQGGKWSEQLVSIIHDARKAALSSQLRINIAEIVVHALEGQGFALIGGQYEGGEMNNAFSARLCSLDGSEVSVRVVPSNLNTGSNEIYLTNQDAEERTDHELTQRAQEITRSLQTYGLSVQTMAPAARPVPTTLQEPGELVRVDRTNLRTGGSA